LGILVALLLGLATSGGVGLGIYLKQRKDAAASERKFMEVIEQQQEKTEQVFTTMSVLSEEQERLRRDMDGLTVAAPDDLPDSGSDVVFGPPKGAAAARAYAKHQRKELMRAAAPPSADLSVSSIRRLHRRLLPRTYAPAGKLREVDVWVAWGTGDDRQVKPIGPKPGEIRLVLKSMLQGWNRQYARFLEAPLGEQLKAVARFHADFLLIHPFLDSNGSVARLLMAMQLHDATGLVVDPVFPREEYVAALRRAQNGDSEALEGLIAGSLPGELTPN